MRKYGLVVTGLALILCIVTPLGSVTGAAFAYTVNTTDDDVDVGGCQQAPTGDCTLREAITDANGDGDVSNIAFNIPTSSGYNPSTGVWTIQLGTALPALTEDATAIMGSTQTGNQGDTNPYGPEIAVNGASAYDCFRLTSASNTVERLAINQCTSGILIVGSAAHDNNVCGNYIGLDAQGTAASGNTQFGIYIGYASDNTIGGSTTNDRNIISANGQEGVDIYGSGADRNLISGNYIGTDASGLVDVGNLSSGVNIGGGAQENEIGPNNIIAYNDAHGVSIGGSATKYNTVTQNSIHSNLWGGILLSGGANDPILAAYDVGAICDGGGASSGANLQWEAFSDFDGEGRFFESTGGTDTGSFAFWPAGDLFHYPNVTLTVTDASGNTSEFSDPVPSGCLFGYLPLSMKGY
ncbi:MAG: CSLREA domain-containing protein [Anaerolineae bacterium]